MSSARTGQRDAAPAPAPGPAEPRSAGWPARAIRFLPIGFAAAVMLAAGLWGLARHDTMGNDEIVTRYASTLSLGQLAHLLEHTDIYHGFYYVVMHPWVAVFGTSPSAIRVPSVIAMAVAAGLMVYIGRRLSGSVWTGLFAGLIMALTPEISFYAQTAREYAAIVAVVLCATLALVRALEAEAAGQGSTRRWVLYGALITLSGYLNELTLAVLAAHLATVLLARPGRQAFRHWFAAGAVGAFLVIPVVIGSIHQDAAASWITRPTAHDLEILFHDYFGSVTWVAGCLFVFAVAAVLPDGRPPWWRRSGISLPSVAAPLLVLPAGLLIAESVAGHPVYTDRYVLYGEAGAAMLAGAGLQRIGRWLAGGLSRPALRIPLDWRVIVAATGAIACLGVLVFQLGAQHRARTPLTREFDFGDPAFYIGAHARPGDGVLFYSSFFRKARLGYPDQFRDTTDFAMAVSPQKSGTLNGFDKPLPVVRSLMLTYRRIWVVGTVPSAHASSPVLRAEGELLTSRFTRIAERHFRGIVVTFWLRR
ncbi:MAG TPA: glycosyltransferase family 39 protein [Streptosporangiaceae bacterium]|nr:glycosyltransferase family 39 protein [Streptosporangiaceae bacterium]